jgi:hypothetical protein
MDRFNFRHIFFSQQRCSDHKKLTIIEKRINIDEGQETKAVTPGRAK